jgi:hypothetical protein
MVSWAKLAGKAWDQVFAPVQAKMHAGIIEAGPLCLGIHDGSEPGFPILSWSPYRYNHSSDHNLEEKVVIVMRLRLNSLRLLIHLPQLMALDFDKTTARRCEDLACDTMEIIRHTFREARSVPNWVKFFVVSSLQVAIYAMSATMVWESKINENNKDFNTSGQFWSAWIWLEKITELPIRYRFGERVVRNLQPIKHAVETIGLQDAPRSTITDLYFLRAIDLFEQEEDGKDEEWRRDREQGTGKNAMWI